MESHFWNLERTLLAGLLLVAAGMLGIAGTFAKADARLFPQLVAGTVVLLSAWVLAGQSLAWRRGERPPVRAQNAPLVPWLLSVLLMVGLALLTYAFGLGIAILVFVTLCSARIGARPWQALLLGIALALVIWFSFGVLLRVPLPVGALVPLF